MVFISLDSYEEKAKLHELKAELCYGLRENGPQGRIYQLQDTNNY